MLIKDFNRAFIVDHLQRVFFTEEDVIILYIYNDYKDQEAQSVANLIGSLLQQTMRKKGKVSNDLMALYKNHTTRQTRPTVKELATLLRLEISHIPNVFLLVDALDECTEANDRRTQYIIQLQEFCRQPNTQLMLTSRPMAGIQAGFPYLRTLEIRASDSDIETYLETRIQKEPRLARHVRVDSDFRSSYSKL